MTKHNIHLPRFLFFMFMRGQRGKYRPKRPITPEGRRRIDSFWQHFNEVKHGRRVISASDLPAGSGSLRSRLRHRVLPEPSGTGPDLRRDEPRAHGSSGPATVEGGNLGWEALEQQLLKLDPSIREVEVKHDQEEKH